MRARHLANQFVCILLSGALLAGDFAFAAEATPPPPAAQSRQSSSTPAGVVVEGSRQVQIRSERDSDPVVNNLERRTWRFFWNTAHKRTGLIPDRYPSPSFASIAAVGFGLTAYVIGSERGYISRRSAGLRVRRTLRFLAALPQGPEEAGKAGYNGFYYHFLDMETGARFETTELSTVDTALLIAGVLTCATYFDQNTATEKEIRTLADDIYKRVNWQWAQNRPSAISHGWRPETGFLRFDWRGYNEAILVYILALGSPTYPVDDDAWQEWTQTYKNNWGEFSGQEFLSFGPLFGHQFSHVWIDFRGIQDEYMRKKGIDYFENSRRAALAHREYAIQNPMEWKGYDGEIWGLSASDGPADIVKIWNGEERGFFTYAGRGTAATHVLDDGTISPMASISSIPFAPEVVIPTIHAFRKRYGTELYQRFGFLDAVNETFTYEDVKLRHGKVVPGMGWIASDYLGIDQGPIVAMIENYRSGLVWQIMRRNPYIRKGLERAGFTGGWLGKPPEPAPPPPPEAKAPEAQPESASPAAESAAPTSPNN
jgi:hypothetical protein